MGRSRFLGDRRLYREGLVCLLPCSFSISRLDIRVTQVPLATAQEGQRDTVFHTDTAHSLVPAMGACHSLGTPGPPMAAATTQGLICTAAPSAAGNKVEASLSMEAATSTPTGLLLPS